MRLHRVRVVAQGAQVKFHVTDPRQPEWQGCFIEGEDLEDALGKWARPTDKTGAYEIAEVRRLGTYKVSFEMSIQPVEDIIPFR